MHAENLARSSHGTSTIETPGFTNGSTTNRCIGPKASVTLCWGFGQGNRIRCGLEQLLRGDWFRQTRQRLLALPRNLVGLIFASR